MFEDYKEAIYRLKQLVLHQIQNKVFGVALALSFSIWFIYSLSGTFTTVITLPVHITGALVGNSLGTTSEETKSYDVDCKVTGSGFSILRKIIFPQVSVNTSDLEIDKLEDGSYIVNTPSLERAISNKIAGVNIENIYTNNITFSALTHTTKVVPVDLDLTLNNDGLYMPIGDVVIEPAEITITGPIEIVNAITTIKSDYLTINSKESSVSGEVLLKQMDDIEFSQNSVYYHIRFEKFIEKKIVKNIEVRGVPKDVDYHYETLPNSVDVIINVAESIYAEFDDSDIKLFIDLSKSPQENDGENIHIIEYDGAVKGVDVRDITPKYVSIYKSRGKGDR